MPIINGKHIVIETIFCIIASHSYSQGLVYNDGGQIYSESGATITIQGDYTNLNNGTIQHYGDLDLTGDWTNNTTNKALTANSSGNIIMNGNSQTIGGSNTTEFYNLIISGPAFSKKQLAIDAAVRNELDLTSAILETNEHQLYVNNPATNSVKWNGGFVSSNNLGGGITRSVNQITDYIFPVGSTNLPHTHRPVIIKPTTTDSSQFSVRVGATNPNTDNSGTSLSGAIGPLSTSAKSGNIDQINEKFYHNIYKSYGTAIADVSIQYFDTDGEFYGVAKWGHTNQWTTTLFDVPSTITPTTSLNNPNREYKTTQLVDFDHDAFALIGNKELLFIPAGITPNGDGNNDLFHIKGLDEYPNNALTIYNRWGSIIYQAAPYLNDWEGKSNVSNTIFGDNDISGTYYYVLKLQQNQDPVTGHIELRK